MFMFIFYFGAMYYVIDGKLLLFILQLDFHKFKASYVFIARLSVILTVYILFCGSS